MERRQERRAEGRRERDGSHILRRLQGWETALTSEEGCVNPQSRSCCTGKGGGSGTKVTKE